ncbi:MAG: transglycosylase SLT domain-containing protein [Cellvibrionaceae bacterium]
MLIFLKLSILIFIFALTGCATRPPSSVGNVCNIFEDKKGWYKAARKSEKKWGSSIPIMMSFIHQESRFRARAKPPRKKILWVLPGPRVSSAFGFPQAKTSTWKWYIKDTGNRGADRDNFKDAIDFVGWYNARSSKTNNIKRDDTYHLYLAYHEGHGGFEKRTFSRKNWLKTVAKKVSSRSIRYSQQLNSCAENLQKDSWWPF